VQRSEIWIEKEQRIKRINDASLYRDGNSVVSSTARSGNSSLLVGFVARSIFESPRSRCDQVSKREKERERERDTVSALRLAGNNFSSKSKAVGAAKSRQGQEGGGEVQFRWLFGYVDLETTST